MQRFLDRVERFLLSGAARRKAKHFGRWVIIGTWGLALAFGAWVLTPPGEQYNTDVTSRDMTQQLRDVITAQLQHTLDEWVAHPVYYAHAQGVLGPFIPTNTAIATAVITPSGAGIQKYIITPTVALISGTTELQCTAVSNANGAQPTFGATDNVLPAFISATTPGAGSPPNYIVLQISSTQAMAWRCLLFYHPF